MLNRKDVKVASMKLDINMELDAVAVLLRHYAPRCGKGAWLEIQKLHEDC